MGTVCLCRVYSITGPIFLMASVHIRSVHYILHISESCCVSEGASLFKVSVLLLGHGLVAMLPAVLFVVITLSLSFEVSHEDLIED